MDDMETGLDIPGVLWRRDPREAPTPLVFDSPHSGSLYPDDFWFCSWRKAVCGVRSCTYHG